MQRNQSSYLTLACPPGMPACTWGCFPRRCGRATRAGSAGRLPFQHLAVIHQAGEEKTQAPKPTQTAEACRTAKGLKVTILQARWGLLLDYCWSQISVPMLDGKCAHNRPPLMGTVLEASWSKRSGGEEPSVLTTTTTTLAEGLGGLTI